MFRPATRSVILLILGLALVLIVAASCVTGGTRNVTSQSNTTPSTQPAAGAKRVFTAAELGFAYAAASDKRTGDERDAMNATCVACHSGTDKHDMHESTQTIACVDCHGGKTNLSVPQGLASSDPNFQRFKREAHGVTPSLPRLWKTSANPEIAGPASLRENQDYVRFVNPGDLRAARVACYACHDKQVEAVEKSMMAHGAMLWGAALYNNGVVNRKNAVYGESYSADGAPRRIIPEPGPTTRQVADEGILTQLFPLPRWEITQPGNILRVFERGGRRRPVLGVPDPLEEPGRPDVKLSVRGFGTEVRTDPVFIGLQKTRLMDPTLNLMGTNDHPGDYRASGCSACHVVYANDRSPLHSGWWARFGNRGESFSTDWRVNPSATTQPATLPSTAADNRESGHPVAHRFVRNMPTSSCISCHIHPGTNVVNSYLGYMWWDNETDGRFMYPRRQRYPTPEQEFQVTQHNPEGSAARGLWSNLYPGAESHAGLKAGSDFLGDITRLNPMLARTQFADFHGHGWVFRAVFKQDREGHVLDHAGKRVENVTAEKMRQSVEYAWDPKRTTQEDRTQRDGIPVHLKDVHLEKGMHCADCHFSQDAHGDGNLYGETRAAVMVDCIDCHGTIDRPANILRWLTDRRNKDAGEWLANAFTGSAADGGTPAYRAARNQKIIQDHFAVENKRLVQKGATAQSEKAWKTARKEPSEDEAAATEDVRWTVVQTSETASPLSAWTKDEATDPAAPQAARFAHTVRKDGTTWGRLPSDDDVKKNPQMALAHGGSMSCYACHTSWNTSCFGCHLPQRANQRKPMLHNEGAFTRNYTNYNYQTLRDDVYMLGIDSTAQKNKIVPIRSACAVVVSSQDANRQWVYTQQQTISAEGFAGTSFSPYFPHTTRGAETKRCTDCHVSSANDNNAIMAQLMLQGTNGVNFVGRFAWVGLGKGGLEAVAVTERDEPQAVIGSRLHELAYPDYFAEHRRRGLQLSEAHGHEGTVLDLQLRGEYLYAACGPQGFIAYDVANIDNKGFSERIVTAPVSPLGQRLYVKSKYATSICSPSTMALDPTRQQRPENQEQKVHPLYAYLYLTDREEGLIVVGNKPGDRNKTGVATLLDGDPENNFLKRALTYNPQGVLRGSRHMALLGHFAYISCDAGIAVLDLDDPLSPKLVTVLNTGLRGPRKVAFQFRYGFVVDAEGLKTIDVTDPRNPLPVAAAGLRIADARDVYVSRTYGYVAAGNQGLLVVDLTRPTRPVVVEQFDAEGQLNDATAVRVGMTNASMFAYVADGRNGLKVLQLTSPEDTPTYLGFSPRPSPRLIAEYRTRGPAIALSEGLDRDRAVDESGHQLSVFGRKGARPFNLEEQHRLYLKKSSDGSRRVYTVSNDPATPSLDPAKVAPEKAAPAPETSSPGRRRPPPRRTGR